MDEQQRREIIPELDQLIDSMNTLKTSYHYLVERNLLYSDKSDEGKHVYGACNAVYKAASEIQEASDALKRAGVDYIKSYVLTWWEWHIEDEPDAIDLPDPDIESVTYQGNNTWEIIMSTVTEGRQRMIVNSNAATWEQVYSCDPYKASGDIP